MLMPADFQQLVEMMAPVIELLFVHRKRVGKLRRSGSRLELTYTSPDKHLRAHRRPYLRRFDFGDDRVLGRIISGRAEPRPERGVEFRRAPCGTCLLLCGCVCLCVAVCISEVVYVLMRLCMSP